MGFLSRVFGAGGPPNRFRTEAEYKRNRARQLARSEELLAELELGGTDLRLAFVLRAAKKAHARKLAAALVARGYGAEARPGEEGTFLVDGTSPPLAPEREVILGWTEDMCRFGYEYGAEFEGWSLP